MNQTAVLSGTAVFFLAPLDKGMKYTVLKRGLFGELWREAGDAVEVPCPKRAKRLLDTKVVTEFAEEKPKTKKGEK